MTRVYKNSLVIALVLLSIIAFGQANEKKSQSDSTNQWEIGLDLLWLIDKNQVPAKSIFIRRNFVDAAGKHKAWRLRIGVDNSYYDSTQTDGILPHDIDVNSILIRPGFEWQKKLSSKYTFFYGSDVHLFYWQEKFKKIYTIVPEPMLFTGTYKTWEVGLVGFLGFKYFPNKWFSISSESSLNLIYRLRRDESNTGSAAYPASSGHSNLSVDELKINVFPISVINLCFKF